MESFDDKMIRYSVEQLLKIVRDLKSSVPDIAHATSSEVPNHLASYLNTAFGENLKRVYIAAKPLNADDKKNVAKGYGRNRWVIILETTSGKYFTIELKQTDPQGNTITLVKPGIMNPFKGNDSYVLDSEGNKVPIPEPEIGQLRDYAYIQCDTMSEGLDLWSLFNRIEGFGLTRYKLDAKPIPDADGKFVGDVDFRGHRFWLWNITRILVPEMPNFIPSCRQSALMKLMDKYALDADATEILMGDFLPLKQKKDIKDALSSYKNPKHPQNPQLSQSGTTISDPHQSKAKKRFTPDEKSFREAASAAGISVSGPVSDAGPAATGSASDAGPAAASVQHQGHRRGNEQYGFTGAAPPLTKQGLANSRWAVPKHRAAPAESSSASMFSTAGTSGSAHASTQLNPAAASWAPQNRRATPAESSASMFASANDSGSTHTLTQQNLATSSWDPENRRANLAESLTPLASPVDRFATHIASDESVVEAVQGWNDFTKELDSSANNDIVEDATPAWLRRSPEPSGSSNVGLTDPFDFPRRQMSQQPQAAGDLMTFPRQNQAVENVQAVSQPTAASASNVDATDPFGVPFGSDVGVTNPFGAPSSSEQPNQDPWW
ncbi:hypothetical protein PG985_001546 [Apiospora marii]|uniref:uncharacterized protein n=1 Tax=Apiospora marii TaxID=335849 RepID=UPI00312D93F6